MKARFIKITAIILVILSLTTTATVLFGCKKDKPGRYDSAKPELIIGCDDYPPYFYMGEDGTFNGIDVEIATIACERIGYKAVFKKIVWSDKNTLLQSGEIDCIWGCFSMNGREDRYNWVGPYMKSQQVVAVLSSSDIYTLADLEGKRIAFQATSKPDEIFSAGTDERIPDDIRIYCFTDFDIIFSSLKSGYVDAIAGHDTIITENINEETSKYRILQEPLLNVNLGIAFLKGSDSPVESMLRQAIDSMISDGTIALIAQKYGLDPNRVIVK